MGKCKIILKIPGTDTSREFNSNRELDEYLWENKRTLLNNVSEGAIFYEVNRRSEMALALENVAKIGKKFDSLLKSSASTSGGIGVPRRLDEINDLAMGVGFSRLYSVLGNPDNMNFAVAEDYQSSLTSEQQNVRTAVGRDVHEIIQAKIDPSHTVHLEVLDKHPNVLHKIEQQVDKMLAEIISKHTRNGKKPKLLTETVLVAKNVDPVFLDIIRTSSLTPSSNVGNIEAVTRAWGRADLIVLDDDGNVFVYDFKNTGSSIEVGTKKNAKNEMNLASYSAVLKQWEIPNKIGGFVEFGVSYSSDGLSVTGFVYNGIKPMPVGKITKAASSYFPSNTTHPVQAISDLEDVMGKIIPDNTFMNQEKLLKLEVEQEKSKAFPVDEGSSLHRRRPNAKYQYSVPISRKPSEMNPNWFSGSWLIGNSKEEIESRIEEYVALANEMQSDILPLVKDIIVDAITTKDMIEFESSLRSLFPHQYSNLYAQLRTYIDNRWTLLDDDFLIQNGFFIFQKPNSGRVEVVMIDTHILNIPLSFKTNDAKDPRRTSILGNFLNDSKVDPLFFMEGTTGNAVLMKAMIYFSMHPEVLGGNKIYQIKAISTKDNHVQRVSNKELDETYKRIVLEYQKKYPGKTLQMRSDILMNDVSAAVEICKDIMESSTSETIRNMLNYKAFRTKKAPGEYDIEDLQRMLMRIQFQDSSMDSKRINANNDLQMAKLALQRGVLVYYGFFPKSEKDVGAYLDRRLAIEGTEASSMKESKSVIMRQLQIIISSFHDIYKQEFVKKAALWQSQYDKFLKEAGISKVIADDFRYFREHWFLKDGDKIHQSMRLIRETDPYWNGKPEEKKLYDLYLSFWNRLRYNDNLEQIQRAKGDGSYYEIPLIRTTFKKNLEAGGFWSATKSWFYRAKRDAMGLLFDLQEDSEDIKETLSEKEEEKLEAVKLPSYIQDFVGDKRLKALRENGTAAYETNMDIVALTMLAVGLRREMSEHAMMLENALRATSYAAYLIDHHNMQQILTTFDKQINSKMFLRSVIDPHNRGIAMLINWAKGITSTGTLAFSWKSFFRETVRGITDAWSRTKFDEMYGDKFNTNDYFSALQDVIESTRTNIHRNSFIMQLSNYFGMANFSASQIVEASKSNYYGLYELGSDVMFITATWPDFIHRTTMLVAHLKHIGALEAYSINNDGVLEYDMKKDKRFQTWLKYHENESSIPDAELDTYVKERDLYRELLKDFENAGRKKPNGEKYIEGDLLPDALSPRTQDNLKTVADRLYGNYDDETKSIMQKSLLGSLFFQFKTYPLERLSHWFKSPTHINDIEYVQEYWEDGSPVIGYIDDENRFRYGHLEDIEQEWLLSGRAWYIKVPNGHEVWGHINRIFAVGAYLLTHNSAEFEHTWKTDPYFRGQIALALYDTLFGVILSFLIHAIFGEETVQNMKNEEWYTRWLYAVGTGMTQDGPVWSLMNSIVGNGAPPSLSILRQYMTNAASVLTGDTSIIYGFANSLGSTREFTSLLRSE